MKKYEFKVGTDSRDAIVKVAALMESYLGKTLGPGGRNYLLPSGITNDGRSIAEYIRFDDECEDSVALALNEITARTDKDVGDNTTTAMVIGCRLTQEAMMRVMDYDTPSAGVPTVNELAQQIEDDKNKVVEFLKTKATEVKTLEDLEHVAVTSMENKDVGRIVAEAAMSVGPDGSIILEEGFNGKVEKDTLFGVKYKLAISAPSMYNTNKKEAVYSNATILVANHVFENYAEISNLMYSLTQEKVKTTALVIVGKQFSIPFVGACANVTRATKFPILLLTSSVTDDEFEDIAAFTDAHYINTHPKLGVKITDAKARDLGLVGKIIAGDKETMFIGGRGGEALMMTSSLDSITRIMARVHDIKEQLDKEKDVKKRKTMEERIATLSGGIIALYVDAKTAAERYYLKKKVEDAKGACKAALKGGMINGGGVILAEAAELVGLASPLYSALKAPSEWIQRNHGRPLEIADDVKDTLLGITSALENAVSVVKTIVTTEGIISPIDEDLVTQLSNKLK